MLEVKKTTPITTPTRLKILVLGHGGHGKGTFCKLMQLYFGLRSLSSSKAAWPYIWPSFDEATDHRYPTPMEGYRHRAKHRMLLKELILLLNCPDKTTLTKIILNNAPIYDGMRSFEEYVASESYFDIIYWIDASNRVPLDKSMEICRPDKAVVVDNNGPEEIMRQTVATWTRVFPRLK